MRAIAAEEPWADGCVLRLDRSQERLLPGSARNRGAALARSGRLLFLDADCVAASDLLCRAMEVLDGSTAVASGAIGMPTGISTVARLRHLLEFKESLPSVPRRRTWMLPSACMAIHRQVFERHGGFPSTRASEDWRLDWAMWQAGESMAFEPRMRVVHLTRGGAMDLARYSRLLGYQSGLARREAGLPGQAVVRQPWLWPLLPLGRTLRALLWCGWFAPSELVFLLWAWPGYLFFAGCWALGFRRALRGQALG